MRRAQIAVVGSASGADELLAEAHALGTALVDAGWRVVCGGLSGVMEAVGRGAHASAAASGSDVIGVLPTLRAADANDFIDIVVPTGMQYARNTLVVACADAVVAVGGGAGTLSEIALAWQMGKPIVALVTRGGWAKELAGRRLDHRRENAIFGANNVLEVVAAVRHKLEEGPCERAGW